MFNDLNNQTNPNRQEVDDIFAETDKPAASGTQADIQIRNVGLASMGGGETEAGDGQDAGKRNYLKLVIIITLSLAIIGAAYLVYSKFLKGSGDSNLEPANTNKGIEVATVDSKENATKTEGTASEKTEGTASEPAQNNFVDSIPGINIASVTPIITATSSEITTSSETGDTIPAVTEVVEPAVSTIDSDSDSLTDEEEKIAGTNINVIDTDNDGLSDYEEVKIYHTNPLSADTDGDGYLDGSEVKNGYNPNGAGKLSESSEVK